MRSPYNSIRASFVSLVSVALPMGACSSTPPPGQNPAPVVAAASGAPATSTGAAGVAAGAPGALAGSPRGDAAGAAGLVATGVAGVVGAAGTVAPSGVAGAVAAAGTGAAGTAAAAGATGTAGTAAAGGAAVAGTSGAAGGGAAAGAATFTAVFDIFTESGCATPGCHQGDAPTKLKLINADAAYMGLVGVEAMGNDCAASKTIRVKANDPDNSLLVQKLEKTQKCGTSMPPGGMLSAAQIKTVRDWVKAGAKKD